MKIDRIKMRNAQFVTVKRMVDNQPQVSKSESQVSDTVKLGAVTSQDAITPTQVLVSGDSPEDKLPLAGAILFLPVIVGAICSGISSAVDKLRLTNYRKRLEKILFKQENLTYDNFDKFVDKLRKDPKLTSELLKVGVRRMHQIQKYDNKPIDRDPEDGIVEIIDKEHQVKEYGQGEIGVYYTYYNKKRGVEVEVDEDILGGRNLYISVYKPISDSYVEEKTVAITYDPSTGKPKIESDESIELMDEYQQKFKIE